MIYVHIANMEEASVRIKSKGGVTALGALVAHKDGRNGGCGNARGLI
jgi:hypothetical protein